MLSIVRDKAGGGRICINVKDNYNFQNVKFCLAVTTTFEKTQIIVELNENVIIVSGMYKPPNNTLFKFLEECY